MTPKEREAMQQAVDALEDELEAETCEEFHYAAEKCHDALAALREALAEQAEQEPECKYKEAYIIWQDKTEWVQETAHPKELGMHRADVLRQRIENLQNAATHPVRTKDLTDEEIAQAVGSPLDEVYLADFRAVIAKDRELNKCQH